MDRNEQLALKMMKNTESLSARRAWIEIFPTIILYAIIGSLSARRAWIEMLKKVSVIVPSGSSLSARRAWIEI